MRFCFWYKYLELLYLEVLLLVKVSLTLTSFLCWQKIKHYLNHLAVMVNSPCLLYCNGEFSMHIVLSSWKPLEGQLTKFTNVVKGWQHRWFLLDPESGMLEYFEVSRFCKKDYSFNTDLMCLKSTTNTVSRSWNCIKSSGNGTSSLSWCTTVPKIGYTIVGTNCQTLLMFEAGLRKVYSWQR